MVWVVEEKETRDPSHSRFWNSTSGLGVVLTNVSSTPGLQDLGPGGPLKVSEAKGSRITKSGWARGKGVDTQRGWTVLDRLRVLLTISKNILWFGVSGPGPHGRRRSSLRVVEDTDLPWSSVSTVLDGRTDRTENKLPTSSAPVSETLYK